MKQEAGVDLVARVVINEIARAKLSKREFARRSGVPWNTVDRVTAPKEGKVPPSQSMLHAVEGALRMPRDFLTYLLTGDRAGIESTVTADSTPEHRDLVRWMLRELEPADGRRAKTG